MTGAIGAYRCTLPGIPAAELALAGAWSQGRDGPVRCAVAGLLHDGHTPAGLAAAWRREGVGALDALRGAGTIVLWDEERGEGLVTRDQLGEGGCAYAAVGGGVAFAADAAELAAALPTRPAPDAVTAAAWLEHGEIPPGRSFHAGVSLVPPGCLLELAGGRARVRRWWRLEPAATDLTRAEAVDAVRAALERAVRRRTAVPSALMLSGGLDSASVAGIAAAVAPVAPQPLSITFPGLRGTDESPLIDAIEAHTGLSVRRLELRAGSALAGLVEWSGRWRAPCLSPNAFYQGRLAALAAEAGAAVLHDGEGGDELFGVSRPLLADALGRRGPVAAVRLARRHPGAGDAPPWRPVLGLVRRSGVGGLGRRPARDLAPAGLVRPALARDAAQASGLGAWRRDPGPRWLAYQRWMLVSAIEAVGAQEHFRRRAGAAGLHASHPLRDLDLTRLVLGLPPQWAWDPHRSRPLLRDAVAGVVPEAVRGRSAKATFDPLTRRTWGGVDDAAARELLADPAAPVRALLRDGTVERRLLDAPSAGPAWADLAFRLCALDVWLRTEADAGWPERFRAPEPLELVVG